MPKPIQTQTQGKNSAIWVVGLIIIVVVIGGYFWVNYVTDKPATTSTETTSVEVTAISELVTDEELRLTEFPFVKTLNFEMGRYDVSFEADKKLRLTLYSEARYNEWLNLGEHTHSKISTQKGVECCAVSDSYRIDINEGEAGTYYFVFEDARDMGASTSSLVVNKIGELGR